MELSSKEVLGEMIQSIESDNFLIVWMKINPFLLVAVSERSKATELHVKLRLEYLWSHILASFTDSLCIHYDPGMDLEFDPRPLLRQCDDSPNRAFAAVSVSPMQVEPRDKIQQILLRMCKDSPNIVSIVLLDGEDIQNIVLPSFPHIRAADLHILLDQLASRSESNGDCWFRICLPRFHSSSFLYCFRCNSIVILSSDGSTNQLDFLKKCCQLVEEEIQDVLENTPVFSEEQSFLGGLLNDNEASNLVFRYTTSSLNQMIRFEGGVSAKSLAAYQRLALDLRYGSSGHDTAESACNRVLPDSEKGNRMNMEYCCLAMKALEVAPSSEGFSCYRDASGSYAGMTDGRFEL